MADALIERLDQTIELVLAGRDATAALADAELSPLAVLASELRWCPSPAFKARLRANLERRTRHVDGARESKDSRGVHDRYALCPRARGRSGRLLDDRVWSGRDVSQHGGGGVHREVRVGDSMLMIGEGGAEGSLAFSPAAFHVYVPDVDATFERAIAAGAKSMGVPEDRSYGERAGFVEDAFGNHWYIATHLDPSPVPQGHRTVTPFIHPRGVPVVHRLPHAGVQCSRGVPPRSAGRRHARTHHGLATARSRWATRRVGLNR